MTTTYYYYYYDTATKVHRTRNERKNCKRNRELQASKTTAKEQVKK